MFREGRGASPSPPDGRAVNRVGSGHRSPGVVVIGGRRRDAFRVRAAGRDAGFSESNPGHGLAYKLLASNIWCMST